jgi:acetylornithine deacetylase/succinyl-diaminopimelate desuccinylase-like protein
MDVRGYINENAAGFFDSLMQWLAIPSISADPGHSGDVRRIPVAEIWETGPDGGGPPAVFAHWPAADPSAPVVLIYGHHDVQPVEPLDERDSPPFQPARRDGQLLARGAPDDKGQVLFHALAVRASLAVGGRDAPPVTLKLLVEGEEESGSTDFAALLEARRDQLACDVIVITDTTMWAADVPSMCTGKRAFGQEVLFTREGGSGPEADLAAILGAPLVFLAVGLDSDRIHAPNERAEMALLLKGAEAAAYLWDELAAAADDVTVPR